MIYLLTPFLTTALPIIGEIGKNILAGINERKARLYNSPAEQVKRLNEAGLPKAAASNLSPGGGVVQATGFGTEQLNANLSSSIQRQIDRKKLQIMEDEARERKAAADIAQGNAQNITNPAGQFTKTNQGIAHMQTLAQQAEAIKSAEIINKYMPQEKWAGLSKTATEIGNIAANTRNTLAQHGVIVADAKIKNIVAKYQNRMSYHELQGLIARNTGIRTQNEILSIAKNVEFQTQLAKITMARNAALNSGQSLEAARLGLLTQQMSMPSNEAYYAVRKRIDDEAKNNTKLFRGIGDLVYLGMFQPTTSNYNFSNLMPSFSQQGDKYFQTYINNKRYLE